MLSRYPRPMATMKRLKQELGADPAPAPAEAGLLRFAPRGDASLEEITHALASLRAAPDHDLLSRARFVDDLDALGRSRAVPLGLTLAGVSRKQPRSVACGPPCAASGGRTRKP